MNKKKSIVWLGFIVVMFLLSFLIFDRVKCSKTYEKEEKKGLALVYDKEYYLKHNPDVLSAVGDDDDSVLEHFLNYGMQQGRRASERFDVVFYRENYSDLNKAFGEKWENYYEHYMQHGYAEGRVTTADSSNRGSIFTKIIVIILSILTLYIAKIKGFFKNKSLGWESLFVTLVLVTSMFLCLYDAFIFGDMCYMYLDIGSDTFQSYYPQYIFKTSFFEKYGNSGYSLQSGLGEYVANAGLSLLNPFDWVFYLFDTINALIVSLYLKVIWTAIFAWAYFRGKFSKESSVIICTLLWSFNGWFILWGQHYQFGTSFAYFTSVIFLVDLLCENDSKGRVFLPVTLALLTGHSYYMMYIVGVFCIVYTLIFGILKKKKWREIFVLLFQLAIAELIAMALSMINLYALLDSVFNSVRVGEASISLVNDLKPRSIKYLIYYLGRMLATNIWGLEAYSGPYNYYEFAISYVSVLSIFAIIYFLHTKHWKKVVTFGLIYSTVIIVPIFSRILVFATNYRWTFLLNFGVVFLTGYFCEEIWECLEANKLSLLHKAVVITNIVFVILLAGGYFLSNNGIIKLGIDTFEYIKVLFVFWSFSILIITLKNKCNVKVVMTLFVVFIFFEQLLMNYNVVNNRGEVSREKEALQYYNDDTSELIGYLEEADMSLYRVNKSYDSSFYNDALVQGYYGVASYSSTNEKNLVELWNSLNISFPFGHPNYIRLKSDQILVNELLGVKYLIAKKGEILPENYNVVYEKGKKIVYEDANALPFGYLYTEELDRGKYLELNSTEEKASALMQGFYFTDDVVDEREYIQEYINKETLLEDGISGREKLKTSKVYDASFEDNTYSAVVNNDNRNSAMLCVPLIYNTHWKAVIDEEEATVHNINGGLVGIEMPEGEHEVRIFYSTIDYVIAGWITLISAIAYLGYLIIWTVKKGRENDKI